MITDKKTRTVETNGVLDQAAYHIDESAMGHITSILSNMYSDPPLAVVREYFSNATDAHVAAGCKDKPVLIKLPTKLDPTFTTRDFGKGLDVPSTKRLLGGYGASGDDKRTSNDMIGGFGIGAKVGFAVSSAFNYTIYHDGRKRVWSCYLDEHDRGRMAMLYDEPCAEPSGIEITIPVAESWIDGFQSATDRAFLFAQVKPELTGLPKGHTSRVTVTEAVGGYDLKLSIDGTDATVRVALLANVFMCGMDDENKPRGGDDDNYRIVIGNAGYAVDTSKLGMSESQKRNADLLLSNIRIEAPIGFLQVAPSREALQYSQRTIKVLRGMLEALLTPRIGLHLAESVAGVTASKANISELAVLSLGLDRLYGSGQYKLVASAAPVKYKDWLCDGSKYGIDITIPNSKLATFTAIDGKCKAYAFRISKDEDRYNTPGDARWSISRINTASALSASHNALSRDTEVIGCVLPMPPSEYTFFKSAASVLAAYHAKLIREGASKTKVIYLVALAAGTIITSNKACDTVIEDSPLVTERVLSYIDRAAVAPMLVDGNTLVSTGYYGAYQLHNGLNEPYIRRGGRRRSWKSGHSNGATKVVAHSRKFVIPADNPTAASDKASDMWVAAKASDIKNSGLIYIPLDEFRVVSPTTSTMHNRNIAYNAKFLTQLKHPDVKAVFDDMVDDAQIVGVRIAEVPSLKDNPQYIEFWQACRNLFSEALRDPGFSDALLVRLALDSDAGPTRRFLQLMDFVVTRSIRVSWRSDAARWSVAFKRAEAYATEDAGLLRLATACYGLMQHCIMWDKKGTENKVLGDITGSSIATVVSTCECSSEYVAAEASPHVMLALWKRVIGEYPMIPYIVPTMADVCGHSSPFSGRGYHNNSDKLSDNQRRCFVTFEPDGSVGDDYLETYLTVMPAVTQDFEASKSPKRRSNTLEQ